MKLCFVVDARSLIAQNWIRFFSAEKHEVHIISSYPCEPDVLPAASLNIVPITFSWLTHPVIGKRGRGNGENARSALKTRFQGQFLMSLLGELHARIGPLDIYRHLKRVRRIVRDLKPDLVHAMRIPFEGLLAAEALRNMDVPLVVSVWGNDFTLFAEKFPLIARQTRRAMHRADALHPDCYRDLRLAKEQGFADAKPAVVLPSNGGIRSDLFYVGPSDVRLASDWNIPEKAPIVLNPRGFRGYIRNDTFFRAIPIVLGKKPQTVFLGVALRDNAIAERWVQQLQIQQAVRLLPSATQSEMANLFRLADVTVSPSEHDGTPNTLLEAMACGTFPVAGRIESVCEWIQDGENGLLCDPTDPESLAQAILSALESEELRQQAAVRNQALISERAEHQKVMSQVEQFYQKIAIKTG